jgi:hypothetical protein
MSRLYICQTAKGSIGKRRENRTLYLVRLIDRNKPNPPALFPIREGGARKLNDIPPFPRMDGGVGGVRLFRLINWT